MSAADRQREHDALRQHQMDNIGTPVVTDRAFELGFIDGYSIGRGEAEREWEARGAALIEASRCGAVWLVEPGEFVVPEYVGRHVCAMPTDHAGPHVCAENGYRFHIASAAS